MTDLNAEIDIPDYIIKERIHDGRYSSIYRAQKKLDGKEVILKWLKEKNLALNKSTYRLRNEYEALNRIKSPLTIKALELIITDHQSILVLENWRGVSLAELIKNQDIDLFTGLTLAVQTAQGIGEIHQTNIIHKDIKPQNVLVNANLSEIKIIDFGIASLVSREVQQIINPDLLEGTIAYISPEQTGRMNRAIDYRTDIYSFGVLLYQLFTKKLPFSGPNAKEVVHQQIAVLPTPPHIVNPDLPEVLSSIIMKCMAKNAEDRYQSVFGVKNDLEMCLRSFEKYGFVENFPAGEHDVYDHFHISQKLYGREKEIQELNKCVEESSKGIFQIVMVRGYSGVGKTSLVHEIHKQIIEKNGYFISGKFEQFKKHVQYFALKEAFQDLIQQLLTESEERLDTWKQKILEAVGANGQLIVDLVPEIQHIIGEQPPVVEVSIAEAENRLNYTLSNFIEVFLSEKHPVLLFLDDLQWIDDASLNFIKFITKDISHKYLLLIGAYRDQEVDSYHILNVFLQDKYLNKFKLKVIDVKPLTHRALEELIQDSLRLTGSQVQKLIPTIFAKTRGNPFFVIQFLKLLYVNGILNFDSIHQTWTADIARIEEMPLSDNVIDLMSQKLKTLKPETQMLLRLGAAIGNHFTLKCLAEIYGSSMFKTLGDLEQARQEELILMKVHPNETENIFFVFQHDRIQQAAYELIPENELEKIHYTIGKKLLQLAGDKVYEQIIEIVTQLDDGLTCIQSEEEKLHIAILNVEAGRKACQLAAYAMGQKYLSIGLDLLGKNAWDNNYELCFSLYENLIICMQMNGETEKAEILLKDIFNHAKSKHDKGRLYCLKLSMLSQRGQMTEALTIGAEALSLFNIYIPEHPSKLGLYSSFIWVAARFLIKKPENYPRVHKVNNEDVTTIVQICSALFAASYIAGREEIFLYIILLLNKLTLKYGNLEYSAVALVALGGLLTKENLNKISWGVKLGNMAKAMILSYPNSRGAALWSFCHLYFFERWNSHAKEQLDFIQETYKKQIESGNLQWAGYTQELEIFTLIKCGENIDLILGKLEQIMETQSSQYIIQSIASNMIYHEFLLKLKGVDEDLFNKNYQEKHQTEIKDIAKSTSSILQQFYSCVFRLVLVYLREAPLIDAQIISNEIARYEDKFPASLFWDVAFFYDGLVNASLYEENHSKAAWKKFITHYKRFEYWAKYSPSYKHQYFLLAAEKARLENNFLTAVENYEMAIKLAEQGSYLQDHALACKLLARFYIKTKKRMRESSAFLARHYMQKSYDLYLKWGAAEIAQILRNSYQKYLATDEKNIFSTETRSSTLDLMDTLISSQQEFDFEAIIEATQVLSHEIVLTKLIQSLLHIVIINAGASRVLLITKESNKLQVRAELTAEQESATLSNIFLEEISDKAGVSIIKYVARSKTYLLYNDVIHEASLTKDPYIVKAMPSSILCMPLLYQGILYGILYLENTNLAGAFTPHRVRILNLLSSQMAISLNNAHFYATLENKVRERTQAISEKNNKLEQTLKALHAAQTQLVEQEKLASLGMMIAGISRKLKNPLNFIVNFSDISLELIEDLLHDLEQSEIRNIPGMKSISAEIRDNLGKVKLHASRVDGIIDAMIMHSRPPDSEAIMAKIPDLLDQAINVMNAAYRKKSPPQKVEIERQYDANIPEIKVFAGNLVRTFIHLLDNAFYFTLEKKKDNPDFVPHVKLRIENLEQEIKISIEDNGPGIPASNLDKVLEYFFTTKSTKAGAGLGLSIAHDIITKLHGGRMEIQSEVGLYTRFIIFLPK